jgi:hypothetical protein
MQKSATKIKNPLVMMEFAVANVEGLIVNVEANQLAIGHVHDYLISFRVAVAGLGVGQRSKLVNSIEVRTRKPVGITLVEISAPTNVPVGQRED